MPTLTLQKNGDIKLPKKILNEMDLFVGQSICVYIEGEQIILEPVYTLREEFDEKMKQ